MSHYAQPFDLCFSPMTASNKPPSKKSAKKKVDPGIVKQRREAIEKRIVKLEGKLNKDRALLLRYTLDEREEEPSNGDSFNPTD